MLNVNFYDSWMLYVFKKSKQGKNVFGNFASISSKANRKRKVFLIVMSSLLYDEYFNS